MEDRLRKFAQLVDTGSFTKAAAELHLSQPALSAAIAKLERELKQRLLVHGVRPLALTPAGQLAYHAAKDLAVHTENLKLRLAELAHQPVALKIGMIDSVADALFAGDVGGDALRGAQMSVVVDNTSRLTEAVERGQLDLALATQQAKRPPAVVEAVALGVEPLVVVAHPARAVEPVGTLSNFISYDQPSNTFRLVSEAFKNYGLTPQVTFYSTSPEVMLRLVLQRKGVAALPYLLVREHLKTGQLVRLHGQTPWLILRPIVTLKRRDKALPLSLKQLTHQLAGVLDQLVREATP